MNQDLSQTIAAISTAMTESGIGIVRMSGEKHLQLLTKYIRVRMEKSSYHSKNLTPFIMDIL